MITFKHGQFFDGHEPILLLGGEIHYFRLPKDLWETHLERLSASGCNTLSTYVPWLIHEESEGDFDFTGRYNPSYDLIGFLELAKKKGLHVFLRPGPYIMAELKNEGLPYWLFDITPSLKVQTFDNHEGPAAILDLMNPIFLEKVRRYYQAFIDAIRPFLQSNGGPIFAIQLDNEIGMLDWVNNKPALTKDVLDALGNTVDASKRRPSSGLGLHFHQRLGQVMRRRFKDYALALKSMLTDLGVKDILWMVNIHGTSGGRATTYPIGMSQLIEVTDTPNLIGGMDVYYDDITLRTFQDVIIANMLTRATITDDKPMTTLEFGVGDGNYGDDLMGHQMESSNDFRLRMHIASGHRMINNYLFSGGINPWLRIKPDDGNDRIAFTGERHGFAAPVNHLGQPRYTYDLISRSQNMLQSVFKTLSGMTPVSGDLILGFDPDDYMTEAVYKDDPAIKDYVDQVSMHRTSVLWDRLIKGILLLHYPLSAIRMDNENALVALDQKCLVMPISRYMDEGMQQVITSHLNGGGKAILVGELPQYDRLGKPCSILSDALGAKPMTPRFSWTHPHLSAFMTTPIEGAHEFRTFFSQPVVTTHAPLIRTLDGHPVAFQSGQAIVIGSDYPGHLSITENILNRLKIHKRLELKDQDGFVITMMTHDQDAMMIHVFNLEQRPVSFDLKIDGVSYQDNIKIVLSPRDARILPYNMTLGIFEILRSSAEIMAYDTSHITFRQSGTDDHITLRSPFVPINQAGTIIECISKDTYHIVILRDCLNQTKTIHFKAGH